MGKQNMKPHRETCTVGVLKTSLNTFEKKKRKISLLAFFLNRKDA